MNRVANACLALILLWTLVPGAGEVAENVIHLVLHGHSAHAEPDGDTHAPDGPEHGCSGTLHLCSCHVSLSCVAHQLSSQAPDQPNRPLAGQRQLRRALAASDGIDHPPRA